jgi:hypothetical protein
MVTQSTFLREQSGKAVKRINYAIGNAVQRTQLPSGCQKKFAPAS